MKQFLSNAFKLHRPSARKREIIDLALSEYTRGYQSLLDWAKDNEDFLEREGLHKEKYTAISISNYLPRQSIAIHSSAKDSLIRNVAANLASYFQLKAAGQKVSFPKVRSSDPKAYSDALDHFIKVGKSVKDYNDSRNELLTKARGTVMPLYFCRADAASQTRGGAARNRNFSLLFSKSTGTLWAVLYLLPLGHELGQPLGVTDGNLVRLDTGELFSSNSKSAILAPLELGRNGWQIQRFLEPALMGEASIQAGYLIRRDDTGEYFLHVSFAFDCLERYTPQAYLGVDRGVITAAAYGLVDAEGAIITKGSIEENLRELQIRHGKERERLQRNGQRVTRRHFKRRAYDNVLHGVANELIDIATRHQAMIVMEDLKNLKPVRGKRVISRFRKLYTMMDYKCRLDGVPLRTVFAAYSSLICHRCGEDVKCIDRLVFCQCCEYTSDRDENAAINIARRALYRKADWQDLGGYRAFHRHFAQIEALL